MDFTLYWLCVGIGFAFSALSFSFTDSLFSKIAAPLLMRPRHFDRPCAVCYQEPIGMSKSFREALRVYSGYHESALPPVGLHRRLSNFLSDTNQAIQAQL